TGASAIQFVPQIQPKAKELFVFQRTAPWVLPKPDTDLGEFSKSIIAKYPAIQASWRALLQIVGGDKLIIPFC
ncbi:NAD(P)/FAD-dependent oxidoreductase, partial [Acinetobacter baumannii]|nr:NAD(P)/FAD-dependent oxidoreductase [Acinetobacter baumannii]